MHNVEKLIKDNHFFSRLANGPCKPGYEGGFNDYMKYEQIPILPEWLDDRLSEEITSVYRNLLPEGLPFHTMVRVVRDPDVAPYDIEILDKRQYMRYIIVSVIDDSELLYQLNYPLIQMFGVFSLVSWERVRAILNACREKATIRIVKDPTPPFLNTAAVDWISLYVGKNKYLGPKHLEGMANGSVDVEFDTHFYDLSESNDSLAIQLMEAVEKDAENREG